jgi:SAM-dependent methyltransferase
MPKPGLTLAPEIYAAALDDSPYFRFYERSPVTRLLLDTMPRYLRDGASVLDLGCGNAIGACHLVASGGRNLSYVGIDADLTVCQWARKVLDSLPPAELRGRIVTQTLEEYLAGPASHFDLILSSWAFRSCVDARLPQTHDVISRAIAGLLAPDGVLLVGDAFIASGATSEEIDRIHRHHIRLAGDRGTGHPIFPPELIATLFERAGLECVERLEVPALPLGQFLRIPHDRFCLQVFRRRGDSAR